jgi:hypothetical protein
VEETNSLYILKKPLMTISGFFVTPLKTDAAYANRFNATLTVFCFFLTAGFLNCVDICIVKNR